MLKTKNKFLNVSRETFFFFLFLILLTKPLIALDNVGLESDANLLMDFESNTLYTSNNIDEQHGIASLTKLMTMYVAMDIIEENKIQLTQEITLSPRAISLKSISTESSGLYYEPGTTMTYEKAIELMLVLSDNSVTIGVAENLAESEKNFVDLMNKKAESLNLKNTKFFNVTGLTNSDYAEIMIEGQSETDYNYSTAREMAILSSQLVKDYPIVLDFTSMNSVDFDGNSYDSHILMLDDMILDYPGTMGLKTGSSIEAKYNYIGYYVDKMQRTYISVVLGASTGVDRFYETEAIYNWIDKQKINYSYTKDTEFGYDLIGDNKSRRIFNPKTPLTYFYENIETYQILNYEMNSEYFNENDSLIKKIPSGEVVFTMYVNAEQLPETIIPYSKIKIKEVEYDVFAIEFISTEDIELENFIVKLTKATFKTFSDMYKEII